MTDAPFYFYFSISNTQRVEAVDLVLNLDHALFGKVSVLRTGKKKYTAVEWA